jgi:hypothetical protein
MTHAALLAADLGFFTSLLAISPISFFSADDAKLVRSQSSAMVISEV